MNTRALVLGLLAFVPGPAGAQTLPALPAAAAASADYYLLSLRLLKYIRVEQATHARGLARLRRKLAVLESARQGGRLDDRTARRLDQAKADLALLARGDGIATDDGLKEELAKVDLPDDDEPKADAAAVSPAAGPAAAKGPAVAAAAAAALSPGAAAAYFDRSAPVPPDARGPVADGAAGLPPAAAAGKPDLDPRGAEPDEGKVWDKLTKQALAMLDAPMGRYRNVDPKALKAAVKKFLDKNRNKMKGLKSLKFMIEGHAHLLISYESRSGAFANRDFGSVLRWAFKHKKGTTPKIAAGKALAKALRGGKRGGTGKGPSSPGRAARAQNPHRGRGAAAKAAGHPRKDRLPGANKSLRAASGSGRSRAGSKSIAHGPRGGDKAAAARGPGRPDGSFRAPASRRALLQDYARGAPGAASKPAGGRALGGRRRPSPAAEGPRTGLSDRSFASAVPSGASAAAGDGETLKDALNSGGVPPPPEPLSYAPLAATIAGGANSGAAPAESAVGPRSPDAPADSAGATAAAGVGALLLAFAGASWRRRLPAAKKLS